MFVRKVAARLKPNALAQFIDLMEYEILPWLRQQEGFLDLITLAVPDGSEVATITFWDHRGDAQAHNSDRYPEVLKVLEEILDSDPYVKTFDVVRSTLQPVVRSSRLESEKLGQKTASTQLGRRSYETRV